MNVYGILANRLKYKDLAYQIKKYVQFAITEHSAELPLLPILPVKLSSLIRFAWWCQWANVKGGMNSIRNYVSAVVEFGLSYGFADPRLQEPWVYQKFRREAGKFIEVYEGKKAKMALTHEILQPLMKMLDLSSQTKVQQAVSYSILMFTAIRRGHLIPKSYTQEGMKHLLRWKSIKFIPNYDNAKQVLFELETGKVRHAAKKDPWWTAVGTSPLEYMCPVLLTKLWYALAYTGDNEQYVLATNAENRPPLCATWTTLLRANIAAVAQQAGVSEDDFNVKDWSGISFRKFSLSALARHVQPQLLAAHGEHGSVEITNKYYVTQTVAQRAEHTGLIAKGFKL